MRCSQAEVRSADPLNCRPRTTQRASTPHGDGRVGPARGVMTPQSRGSFCVPDIRFGFTTKLTLHHQLPTFSIDALAPSPQAPLLEQLDADAVGLFTNAIFPSLSSLLITTLRLQNYQSA